MKALPLSCVIPAQAEISSGEWLSVRRGDCIGIVLLFDGAQRDNASATSIENVMLSSIEASDIFTPEISRFSLVSPLSSVHHPTRWCR